MFVLCVKYYLHMFELVEICIMQLFLDYWFEGDIVSPRVPLIEVLMITNQGYWLLMVNIELSDRLKLIKHQMKIFQA